MNVVDLIGYSAATLTTVSFIPQALKTIRTKNTQGISLIMYLMFSIGVLGWLVYGFATQNMPVLLANGITLLFAIVILFYKIRYR